MLFRRVPEISCPPTRSRLSAHPDLPASVGKNTKMITAKTAIFFTANRQSSRRATADPSQISYLPHI